MNRTREDALRHHNNDYRSALGDAEVPGMAVEPVSVNVVVPYFNAAETFPIVVTELARAVEVALDVRPGLEIAVTIVDDGSRHPPILPIGLVADRRWMVVRSVVNGGRAKARNIGLACGNSRYTLFVDSDVVLYPTAIAEHIAVLEGFHCRGRVAVSCGLFHFTECLRDDAVQWDFGVCNDFRMRCTYQEAWIGCAEDRQFVGREFRTLEQTENWSAWPEDGQLGPWMLPNMVLGGLFCVPTEPAREVGGQDQRFRAYGFEETTLVTKLLTKKAAFVVPVLGRFAKHLETSEEQRLRQAKDEWFRDAHARYFTEYLREPA